MATTGTRSAARSAAARLAGLVALTFVLAGMLAPAAFAVGSPDLTITKTSDAAGTLAIGDQFTYTLTVSNVGDATAHGVIVSDDFPTGVGPVGVHRPAARRELQPDEFADAGFATGELAVLRARPDGCWAPS